MKRKLIVICGGQSSEHIVSRMSCTSVLNNLNRDLYQLTLVGIDTDGRWYLLDDKQDDLASDQWLEKGHVVEDIVGLLKQQDVALPILHGRFGEDGTIQGLFELVNLPYAGCRVLDSAVCMDKVFTKKILKDAGIPQVKSLYVKKRNDGQLVVVFDDMSESSDLEHVVQEALGFPCFIKASRSGSSIGCFRCDKPEDLRDLLLQASEYDKHIVVEENIDCIELETAVLGNDDVIVSRVGQIMPHGEFYTFESKYEDEESQTCIPALVDQSIQDEIRQLAKRAFLAVDGHGLSRVDFFLDKKTNRVYLNEINTLPGFTKISMYPQLMNDFGIGYSELLDKMIELAFEK